MRQYPAFIYSVGVDMLISANIELKFDQASIEIVSYIHHLCRY